MRQYQTVMVDVGEKAYCVFRLPLIGTKQRNTHAGIYFLFIRRWSKPLFYCVTKRDPFMNESCMASCGEGHIEQSFSHTG